LNVREAIPSSRLRSGPVGWIARLVRVLVGVLADRLVGRLRSRRDGVPVAVEDVNAEWLTEALQATHPGARVERVERLGGHEGTTARERLAIVGGVEESPGLPRTLFLKTAPRPLATRLFTTLFDLGAAEVDFYASFGESFPIRIPRAHCARRAGAGGRFVLLLEDLEASGCRFTTAEQPRTLAEARAVVETLAHLHAAFWESPRFSEDLAWLRSPGSNPEIGLEWWISARSNEPALARFGDCVSPEVRRNAHRIHDHRPLLESHWARLPRTLIHGDPHAGNLYFAGDEVGFFDWQVVQAGPGLRDVGYFLVNSVETDLRRRHERELLAHYAGVLRAHNVPSATEEAMWEEYRLFALYTWIAISVTGAAPGLQPREVVRRAFARTGAALDDLGSFEALDALVQRSQTG